MIALLVLFLFGSTNGIIITTEKRQFPHINTVYLHCRENDVTKNDLTNPVQFYRWTFNSEGEMISKVYPNASSTAAVTVVDIDPLSEGVFTCVDNTTNMISTNNISLVGKSLLILIE